MKKKNWLSVGALVLAASAFVAIQAEAGSKTPVNTVNINTVARTFSGALGAVRNSSSTSEYINCSVSSAGTGNCTAKNSAGTLVVVNTTNATIMNLITSMNGDCFINVSYDSSNNMTSMIVANGSHNAPKVN